MRSQSPSWTHIVEKICKALKLGYFDKLEAKFWFIFYTYFHKLTCTHQNAAKWKWLEILNLKCNFYCTLSVNNFNTFKISCGEEVTSIYNQKNKQHIYSTGMQLLTLHCTQHCCVHKALCKVATIVLPDIGSTLYF